jgi:hypothetical protein
MTSRRAITIKEAAFTEMERAYLKASAGGRLPAKARQIMYAARGKIQELTGKPLNDQYFTQTLLPDYMAEHPSKTSTWRVVFDARGHLTEPHTKRSVPLGTIDVGNYLSSLNEPQWLDPAATMPAIRTCGPSGRYGALLFVEKEGFDELFAEVRLGERYDTAIMSTKGVSVTAARRLVDHICARYQVPLFVLHDFDRSGFIILRTLRESTRRYYFRHCIDVIDLGLRLEDVEACGLESEDAFYREHPDSVRRGLTMAGATKAEIDFLLHNRVELNAFASDEAHRVDRREARGKWCPQGDPRPGDARRGVSTAAAVGVPEGTVRRAAGAFPPAYCDPRRLPGLAWACGAAATGKAGAVVE